ncbi:hypothetical protein [Halocatena salina]|uniref:Uncharacterized protein n=1 Tax=Halocatena salina TaxID=2934340 RepID=A0A8U0A238_9EURY|nr:hypothetical protein [Halocatena salina]UPM42103.1 hypothetical protein MW046_09010 [Halocatena salina]
MSRNRRKGRAHHLTEDELDRRLPQADGHEIVRRPIFIKNSPMDDTLEEPPPTSETQLRPGTGGRAVGTSNEHRNTTVKAGTDADSRRNPSV